VPGARKTLPTILKMDENCCYVAVPDPASGRRGRYTVHRIYRWADKHTDIIGRELPIEDARRVTRMRGPRAKIARP
jgi:hypothetical protein